MNVSVIFFQSLKLLWKLRIRERLSPTAPPLVANGVILVNTMTSELFAYSVSRGEPLWSLSSPSTTTPPTIWAHPKALVVAVGTSEGMLLRGLENGEMLSNSSVAELFTEKSSFFQPIAHKSELIVTSVAGAVAIFKGNPDNFQLEGRKLSKVCRKPSTCPSLIYNALFYKPSDEEHFVFDPLSERDDDEQVLGVCATVESNFSRACSFKNIIAFGGRDNKLHLVFVHQRERGKQL